ncbi:YaiO family outer membrane beta-barrel protein [Pedobacter sp. LMG 31464]|uniref:YaiO family outer membrane beta-barrel protein n=1 Tax=Pedobacter planticolens TaxID=2679964 RepID=A0A923IUZ3_9SPHI|nr:YaiO family outer membrane beta-barrel protein [Pedobacter planticolens]MBB2145426.1 YaiO family outer membrane beta-barrel protein [Pedobacter planticolens]
MKYSLLLSLFILLFCITGVKAQSADDLFTLARKAAFDENNYPKAISLSKTALQGSPDYADIRVFLGRLYTWSKKPDSARLAFNEVISKQPAYEDAYVGLGNLEFWNDNSEKALDVVNTGLKNAPTSEPLQLLKAKVLNDLRRWQEADVVVSGVLKNNPTLTEARSLASRIKENSAKNKVSLSYDYIYFDKQFDDPWHLVSVDYGRQTKYGSIIGRVNYANRFNTNGYQFEVDAYPHISNTFYAYVSGGISNTAGVFPKYRAGFSLYANLPLSFEAEAGFRLLHFSDNTWIYTASVSKYYKSFWFNFRTYLTPSNNSVSQSYALTTRYYFGGVDDYFSLALGTGLSPDDNQNNVLLNSSTYRLKSNNISLGYRKSIKTFNVLMLKVGYDNQEYLKNTKGNQLDFGIGYLRRF